MNAERRPVLLVDADADSRQVYRTILEFAGHRVVEAADGRHGLALALEHLPGVVVAEFNLPDGRSGEFIRRLKADPATTGSCVIVVSAQAFEPTRRMALEAGCWRFLPKPLEPRLLSAEIDHAMAGGSAD
jgi:CheY-like chemotaxis protein